MLLFFLFQSLIYNSRNQHISFSNRLIASRIIGCGVDCTSLGQHLCEGFKYMWEPEAMEAPVCEMLVNDDDVALSHDTNMYHLTTSQNEFTVVNNRK